MKSNKTKYASDIAFTPSVKSFQKKYKSRGSYERMEERGGWQSQITPQLSHFLLIMDSFYLSTSNGEGQPYVQHRGGPRGFLKVIDHKTLAFADFAGNQQFITTGNLEENDKAFIFLMDYPNRRRIKIWGTAKVIFDDKELIDSLADSSYKAKVERAIVFKVKAWDSNCPQHIQQRYTLEEINDIIDPLNKKIEKLETLMRQNNFNL